MDTDEFGSAGALRRADAPARPAPTKGIEPPMAQSGHILQMSI